MPELSAFKAISVSMREHRLAWVALVLAIAALLFGSIVWRTGGFTARGYELTLAVGFCMAVALGLIFFGHFYRYGFASPIRPSPGMVAAWCAVGTGLVALMVWQFGRIQFGGGDHGLLIELGWRMFQGQRPTVDFPCTLPVGFLLGAHGAFSLFGVSWNAIIAFNAIFAACTFIWLYLLLIRLEVRADLALLFGLSWQAATNVFCAVWWYNPATSTLAVIFFLSALCFWRRSRGHAEALSYIASLTLVASMKPNVVGLLVIGTTVALLTSRPHRRRVSIYSSSAFLIFIGGLALAGISWMRVISEYLSVSGRGFNLEQFLQDMTPEEKIYSIVLMACACVPLLAIRPLRCLGERADRLIVFSAIAASLSGLLTNGEHKICDLPLLMAAGLWLARNQAIGMKGDLDGSPLFSLRTAQEHVQPSGHCGRGDGQMRGRLLPSWAVGLSVMVLVFALVGAAVRERVFNIGLGIFFEYKIPVERVSSGFFKGMRASQTFLSCNEALASWVTNNPRTNPFLGPRLFWGYAAFRLASPKKTPPFWHAGVSYDKRDEALLIKNWKDSSFPYVIFYFRPWPTKEGVRRLPDLYLLPIKLLLVAKRDYEQWEDYGSLIIFKRKAD